QFRVLRPVVLDHVLATRIELVRDQRVERPFLTSAVTVHHHDLLRASGFRTADGAVDLLGVELATLVVRALLLLTVGLLPLDDSRHAFHVTDDEDLHWVATAAGVLP